MSDFPTNGDIPSTRAWLDAKGFRDVLKDWTGEMILGLERGDFETELGNVDPTVRRQLWSLLNIARRTQQVGKY